MIKASGQTPAPTVVSEMPPGTLFWTGSLWVARVLKNKRWDHFTFRVGPGPTDGGNLLKNPLNPKETGLFRHTPPGLTAGPHDWSFMDLVWYLLPGRQPGVVSSKKIAVACKALLDKLGANQ